MIAKQKAVKKPSLPQSGNTKFRNIPANKNKRLKNTVTSNERSLPKKDTITKEALAEKLDSLFNRSAEVPVMQAATNAARSAKSQVENSNVGIETYVKELRVFEIQWHKILANSLACVAMFLIGAPLGAIIKKGGLGVPFLVSILFFIIYYILSMQGEKLAKQNLVSAFSGIWAADLILLIVGLLFLRQARVDARLFEADFYAVAYARLKQWTAGRKVSGKMASN
jgi:lipopolysaccharide export system permease protein